MKRLIPSLLVLPVLAFSMPVVNPAIALDTATAPQLIAQQSRTQRIRFGRGETGATINNAVVRGTRDTYLLNARSGQKLMVKLTSVEGNASFDLAAPASANGQRRSLKTGATSWTGTLQSSGDYAIVIGSDRGNATYRLQVSVK